MHGKCNIFFPCHSSRSVNYSRNILLTLYYLVKQNLIAIIEQHKVQDLAHKIDMNDEHTIERKENS